MDRAATLEAEGFTPFDHKLVGVPFYVWVLNVDLEISRFLKASEEAILGLLDLGLTTQSDIMRLLGLEGERLFSDLMIDLVRSGGVEMREDSFSLTKTGRQMLESAKRKDVRRSDGVHVRYDPYLDSLRPLTDEDDVIRNLRAEGLEELALNANLTRSHLYSRLEELAQVLHQDSPDVQGSVERLRVLRLDPVRFYTTYQRAELEVWHRTSDGTWSWRLTDVGEETRLSEKLQEFERDQVDSSLIPKQRRPLPPEHPFPKFALLTFEHLKQTAEWVFDYALEQKVTELIAATEDRILVSLSARTAPGILDALDERLRQNDGPAVTVVAATSLPPASGSGRALKEWRKTNVPPERLRIVELMLSEESLLLCGTELCVAAREHVPLRFGSQYVVSRFGARYLQDEGLAQEVWQGVLKLLDGAA